MVHGWCPFKIVSDLPIGHLKWQPLLKIEVVSCCFFISQNDFCPLMKFQQMAVMAAILDQNMHNRLKSVERKIS
jgi:hypothetical protein